MADSTTSSPLARSSVVVQPSEKPLREVQRVTIVNAPGQRVGRNAPCPQHPGVKFKNCACSKEPKLLHLRIKKKWVES